MKIKIPCPACGGNGKLKALDTKCSYCHGKRKLALTQHLKIIGHTEAHANVSDYERRMEEKAGK